MKPSHPRMIGTFEVRSMVLFASLAFGGAAGAQTTTAPAARSVAAPATSAAAGRQTAEQAAFARADSNQDGQLSASEAQQLPAIANRLREIDTDANGSLSFNEFQRGARQ